MGLNFQKIQVGGFNKKVDPVFPSILNQKGHKTNIFLMPVSTVRTGLGQLSECIHAYIFLPQLLKALSLL